MHHHVEHVAMDAYPNAKLIPIHWGCVHAGWKEFNGDPAVVREMIINPDRLYKTAVGEAVILEGMRFPRRMRNWCAVVTHSAFRRRDMVWKRTY